jgi:hypothetical protein
MNGRFFCALEPSMRSSWGKRVAELLKHDGELITLMFPVIVFHHPYLFHIASEYNID